MATLTLTISIVCFAGIILSVSFFPHIKIKKFCIDTYWIVALVCAGILLACGALPVKEWWSGLTANTAVNPVKILVLFLSMTVMSIFLDTAGFFSFIASKVISKTGNNQFKIFLYLYLTEAILTIFTSNDIIVLTFTPCICFFCKRAEIDPLPYLISEFISVNTWSMFLIIGNPTNIYLATASGIAFWEYVKIMALPTLFSGMISFAVLSAIFYKKLKIKITTRHIEAVFIDRPMVGIGLFNLVACIVMLSISYYVGLEMWYISLGFALLTFFEVVLYKAVRRRKPVEIFQALKRTPFQLVPFVISMFTVVLALNGNGFTSKLAEFIGGGETTVLKYGVLSTLAANLINNIPMSVFFSYITRFLPEADYLSGVCATIVGSNIGAFLTPVGALAGIMWTRLLSSHDIKVGFLKFSSYGIVIAVPTLLAAIGGLYLSFCILG